MTELTRIDDFGTYTAKRDDLACYTTPDMPSGSKVRQYAAMAALHPGQPMIVGCSAASAMQIYVAAAAKAAGVLGVVVTAKRADRTDATAYAKRMGARVIEVYPGGYLNVLQARASEYTKKNKAFKGGYVRWSEDYAIRDAMLQTNNLPIHAKRILVPVGSGLVLAGILAGLAIRGISTPVHAIAVSPMAQAADIRARAHNRMINNPVEYKKKLPRLTLVQAKDAKGRLLKYDQPVAAILPDGTPLDPFYAAKAARYLKPGDCFWLPGLRPLVSMPRATQERIIELQMDRLSKQDDEDWHARYGR